MRICHLPSLLFEALRRRISFMFTDNDAKKKWDFSVNIDEWGVCTNKNSDF